MKIKRVFLILFCFALGLLFSGCAKDAKQVSERIDSIGIVTVDSASIIQEAEEMYAKLSNSDKKKVENYSVLEEARLNYDNAVKYSEAYDLMKKEQYEEAAVIFKELYTNGGYEDSADLFQCAKNLAAIGDAYGGVISDDFKTIFFPEYATDEITYKELAKAYCGDEELAYIVYPKTYEDHWNNVKFVFLMGRWDYKNIQKKAKWNAVSHYYDELEVSDNQYRDASIEAALLGNFGGGTDQIFFYYEDYTYHATRGTMDVNKLVSPKEYWQRNIDTYVVAKNQYEKFRSSGKITEKLSEYEKAKVWSDWFCTYKMTAASYEVATDQYYSLGASPYGALVKHETACGGRAAAFNIFMNMEGITSYCLWNGDIGSNGGSFGPNPTTIGHIVPWMILDGEEYIFEYNGRAGLMKVDKENASAGTNNRMHLFNKYYYNTILKKVGLPYDNQYESYVYENPKTDIGQHLYAGNETIDITEKYGVPKIAWEYIKTENNTKYYSVKLIGNYEGPDSAMARVIYGTKQGHLYSSISIGQLKQGSEFKVDVNEIEKHNIVENIIVLEVTMKE